MPPRPPVYVNRLVAAKRAALKGKREPKTAQASGDHNRPHSRARGYDRTWEKLRIMHLNAEPFCRMCAEEGVSTPADMVDHILTVEERPDLRLVDSNLQSLCNSHHSGAKQRADRARRRGRGSTPT